MTNKDKKAPGAGLKIDSSYQPVTMYDFSKANQQAVTTKMTGSQPRDLYNFPVSPGTTQSQLST